MGRPGVAAFQEFFTISHLLDRASRLTRELALLSPTGVSRFVFAPGRINVLGEHTDYSGGFCLPAAVDRGLLCAFAPIAEPRIRAVSLDAPGRVELSSDLEPIGNSATFGRYVAALAAELVARGIRVSGLALALGSSIPKGGGMSSSAALCVALTLAMTTAVGVSLAPLDVALVAQAAEHRVGVRCGLMDQYSIAFGKAQHALLLDCRAQSHRHVPLDLGDALVVVGDTRTPRGLVDSEYNARREQVEEAARVLDGGRGELQSLRDATPDLVNARKDDLGPLLFRRAIHVVEENARTLTAARLLSEAATENRGAVIQQLGRLLDASHASLRDAFEVSCPELDALVTSLREQGDQLVPGARMMGGGFGGCVISLVQKASLQEVLDRATDAYRSRTGKEASFFPVEIGSGARLLPSDPSTLS